MKLSAITREVSPRINSCQLSFHSPQPIDIAKAKVQHKAYCDRLAALGVSVISLPAEPELPDSVFVEDASVVTDEIAVIPIMGAPSRQPESRSLMDVLSRYRPIEFLVAPATLDGGDVLRVGHSVFVGASRRTNAEGIAQLTEILCRHNYHVQPVEVQGCLHLKSACSYIGNNSLLINQSWIETGRFCDFELIDVPRDEPAAANALLVKDIVIIPTAFPKTCALLKERGFRVQTIDLSELQKAEAGVTCGSILFSKQEIDV